MKFPKFDSSLLVILPMLLLSLAGQADPWKEAPGHGHGKGAKPGKWEERYDDRSGDCRYRSKSGPGGYKEDVKCKDRSAKAGPPPWAPAHGYRDKYRRDDAADSRYASPEYDDEYTRVTEAIGIDGGTCDRETLGGLLGGIVGGVAGSKIGRGDGRRLAIVAGTVMGVLVGRQIGRNMDEADQQCVGQALERASDGQPIHWRNADSGLAYEVTPLKTFQQDGRYCREYQTDVTSNKTSHDDRGIACRNTDGSWSLASQSF